MTAILDQSSVLPDRPFATLADRHEADGRRRLPAPMAAVAVLAGAMLIISVTAGAVLSSHHGQRVDEVVAGATAISEAASYQDVVAATTWATTDADSGGGALYALLSFPSSAADGPGRWAPGDVQLMGTSVVAHYDVRTTARSSCVVSVLRPDGHRVETVDGSCWTGGPLPDELWSYIQS